MSKKIAILGAGGFGQEMHAWLEAWMEEHKGYKFIGFFDDDPSRPQLLGSTTSINQWEGPEPLHLIVAVGDGKTRKMLIESIKNPRVQYPNLIHPKVTLGHKKRIQMGVGCIITTGCVLTTDISIGSHVVINVNCTIGHNCKIDDYCSLMPGVHVAGNVHLHEAVYVGSGANILNGLEVGKGSLIGAGAVVNKSIPAGVTAMGMPARALKRGGNDE